MANELLLFHYRNTIVYSNADLNAIGATTSTTLRTVTANNDATMNYVRKFGYVYAITDVTNLSDPGVANLTWTWKALNGTTMGTRANGGAFVDGAAVTSQGCYLVASAAGGAATLPASMTVTTNVDAGGMTVYLPQETIAIGTSLTLYVSNTGSTYYDAAMMYGGARHTPAVGDQRKPYFTIGAAITAIGARTTVTVVDSAIYDEEVSLGGTVTLLQSAIGQTPTITCGIGARTTRTVAHDGNNTDTAYVSKTGVDAAGGGTWAAPYLTVGYAYTNRGGRTYIGIKDNGIYTENLTFSANVTLEPIYGKTPYVVGSMTLNTTTGHVISGMNLTGDNNNLVCTIAINLWAGYILDCSFSMASTEIYFSTTANGCTISRNIFSSAGFGIYGNTNSTINISKNIGHSLTNSFLYVPTSGATTTTINANNNIIYNCYKGIHLLIDAFIVALNGTIENNTIFSCGLYGLYLERNGGAINYTGTCRDNIVFSCTTKDLYSDGATATITESNYGTNTGWTIGAGCITTNPLFSKTTSPYMLGLRPGSGAYKTDTSTSDMGAQLMCCVLGANSQTVNGFIIDAQSQYFNCVTQTATRTSCVVKWCTIKNAQGIAIDNYATATTTTSVLNCLISNSGTGIYCPYGGNTLTENIVYNNVVYNAYLDYAETISHCIFYGAQYGIYLSTNGTLNITNSTMFNNSSYAIYSVPNIVITYCCWNGTMTATVDTTSTTNINDNPYFIDTTIGAENFHIKTTEAGYLINSPCKTMGSDGYDIGAYKVNRAVSAYSWKKYQLEDNPMSLDPEIKGKGIAEFETASGSMFLWKKASKIHLPFLFSANQANTATQRKTLQYLSTLTPSRENGLMDADCLIRVHIKPSGYIANYDPINWVVNDGAFSGGAISGLVYDEFKGFNAQVCFATMAATIDGTAKTLTDGTMAWTTNQWVGFYVYIGFNYYYILSNTGTALTVSDPNGTLVSAGPTTICIFKYYKITKNTDSKIYITGYGSELASDIVDMSLDVDFIECRVTSSFFKSHQTKFYWDQEVNKNGYAVYLEET